MAMNAVDKSDAPAGYCVTHDIGDRAGGIHPHNKTEVGRRLSLVVRTKMFEEKGLPLSPEAVGASIGAADESRLEVRFTSGAAVVWGSTHNCSTCCDISTSVVDVCAAANCTDPIVKWTPVSAEWSVSDNALVATVPAAAPRPSAARYAWSNFPECVLFDKVNALPVGPFSLVVK